MLRSVRKICDGLGSVTSTLADEKFLDDELGVSLDLVGASFLPVLLTLLSLEDHGLLERGRHKVLKREPISQRPQSLGRIRDIQAEVRQAHH